MSQQQEPTPGSKNDELVIIETSDGANEYQVSKAALVKSSEYFRAALQGDFEEAETKRIKIPGSDPKDVWMLVRYVRGKDLPKYAEEVKDMEAEVIDAAPGETNATAYYKKEQVLTERYKSLADLYMLAEYVMMPALQVRILGEIMAIMKVSHLPVEAVKYCFGHGRGTKLGHTFVTQARHEFFHTSNITYKQLTELASVEGFMEGFMEEVFLAIGDYQHELRSAWGSLAPLGLGDS